MKKRKSLAKKVEQLKSRMAKDAKKLAKLTSKLGDSMTKGKSKGKKAAASAKRDVVQKSEAAPKEKKKLNLTPERRAELAAAMKARWEAKRAATAAPSSQDTPIEEAAPPTEASPPSEPWRGVVG